MKFRKPAEEVLQSCRITRGPNGDCGLIKFDDLEVIARFLDSLPSEFEILGPGEVAVKWPEGLTRERLENLAIVHASGSSSAALHALAAIAPERKKWMVNLWRNTAWDKAARPIVADCSEQFDGSLGWRKVAGPIEIDD